MAGAVIILLTMMMIVRERRREIGVIKAVGASNGTVVAQFISEALTFTTMSLVAGLAIGMIAAAPVTSALVSSSSTTASTAQPGARAGGPGGMRQLRQFGGSALSAAQSVQASVGWQTVAAGVGVAFIIAIVGSAIPAFLISRIRPAEVMRAE
jgi:putative ABC transport system permease protein